MRKNPTNSNRSQRSVAQESKEKHSSSYKQGWKVKPSQIERTSLNNLRVLYEDNHIIAVNKRPSDIVQADHTKDTVLSSIVSTYLAKKHNKPGEAFIAIIHRIDRPVSGVIVYAKTSKAAKRLTAMFKNREIQKTYWAIVENAPPKAEDVVQNYLKKNGTRNKSYVHKEAIEGAKKSELSYKFVGSGTKYHFMEVYPKTGRHHQIRTTLSNIGCAIKGDVKYMAKRTNNDASVCLHARKIEFIHPVKKEPISITAPPPENNLWAEFIRLTNN